MKIYWYSQTLYAVSQFFLCLTLTSDLLEG